MSTLTAMPAAVPGPERAKPTRSWHALVAVVAKARHDPGQAAFTATVRLGGHPATETSCYGLVDRFLTGLPTDQRPAARRTAALVAKHPGLSAADPETWMPLGATLAALHRAEYHCQPGAGGPNTITGSVDVLSMLNLDAAANSLDILLGRAATHHLSLDFFSLGRTLLAWGNGIAPASLAVRSRVVTDFYTAT